MILTTEVEIRLNNKNTEHFKKLGYDITQKQIIVKVEDLMRNSTAIIKVKCDDCGEEKNKKFAAYKKPYHCKNCNWKDAKKTKLEKYNDTNYVNFEKGMKTKLKRYGSENYNNMIKNKKTKLELYENEHYNNREKSNETCLEKYGVENVSQSEIIKKIKIKTCLQNYGVEHPLQSDKIYLKLLSDSFNLKKHESNLYYQSGYEKDFLDKYYKKIKIERGNQIWFNYKNKNIVYYPDYYLPEYNLIIEIKSDYYYRKKLNLNIAKKINTEKQGYNFLFIIDKKYEKLDKIIKKPD